MKAVQFPRRDFVFSLLAVGIPRLQSNRKDSVLPIRVSTLNHVSFSCDDLKKTVQWYGRVFGMAVHAFQDYGGGQTVLRVGNGPAYMALSQRNAKTRTRQGDTVEIR